MGDVQKANNFMFLVFILIETATLLWQQSRDPTRYR
jgi:hypothetical protein